VRLSQIMNHDCLYTNVDAVDADSTDVVIIVLSLWPYKHKIQFRDCRIGKLVNVAHPDLLLLLPACLPARSLPWSTSCATVANNIFCIFFLFGSRNCLLCEQACYLIWVELELAFDSESDL